MRKLNRFERITLETEACKAFKDWVSDLTDGEIEDMLNGNSSSYSGMPDLSK